ncbi:peptidase S16 lon domain protein [Desulfovibrio sp. X2]|uniref:Lon protease family protein n=1 Tax=Desulfovibrio sp. X2 TaxID=941449 RepID=UPI000358A09D|nr:ATP-binding protein [Desulfovibrio sp. X2]EPR43381.1 peptidase S16 lon domain protein [Desulfovibrio sp. X2]
MPARTKKNGPARSSEKSSTSSPAALSPQDLRWRCDPASLGFSSTADLEPLDEILGQKRGVEAFGFGMGLTGKGYNIFLTGPSGTGRLSTIKRLLHDLSGEDGVPEDLAYVNNFKHAEQPILLRFTAGKGLEFQKGMKEFLEQVKREVPQIFESEEYIQRKNSIAEAHEKRVMAFYKEMEEKVRDTGLVVVNMQMGPFTRPDVLPVVDGQPKRLIELEDMVEHGRFPREEFERLKGKREQVKEEIDHIIQQVREMQKEVQKKHEEVDRLVLMSWAQEAMKPLREKYAEQKIEDYLDAVLEHMVENLDDLRNLGKQMQGPIPGMMMTPQAEAVLHPYEVNLIVDNSETKGPPVIIESYPTYRNLFGSIERVTDRTGTWRTDFSRIKAGAFVKANGGFLVLNLMDAIMEPGVWPTLKRSLKTEQIEIETYDPYYFFTATGLKPEPIPMKVKVVVYGDSYLYALLRAYDPDMGKIFKVRADWETSMDRDEEAVSKTARFVSAICDEEKLAPFSASGVARVVEEAVRMAGRREKMTTAFPRLTDLLQEADFFARRAGADTVEAEHVQGAVDARIHRHNQIEERLQEMIDRGSLFVDVTGAAVGQVNGLAVYGMADYAFGRPSRITASVSMGKEGIINIEREAELSGPTHNKGVLILSGWLRRTFSQNRPLTLAASIAFEQSYGGIDGDSASSTEAYALLSALSGVALRQDVAVTGSVNQKGEVQPIGGVNEKIEGFFLCCRHKGLTGTQGVMIPAANVKDLMLAPEVVKAVGEGKFHVWAVRTLEEGIAHLTGREAGTRDEHDKFPEDSVFGLADAKLTELAEGLREFMGKNEENGAKGGKSRKGASKDKK